MSSLVSSTYAKLSEEKLISKIVLGSSSSKDVISSTENAD